MLAGANIGAAIIQGMINGLAQMAQKLYNKAMEIAGKVLDILKAPWKAFSPSRVTHELGVNIIQGLINGLVATAPGAYKAASNMSLNIIKTVEDIFQISSPSEVMRKLGSYVGKGFQDGLRGSFDNIVKDFGDLNQKITEATQIIRDTIDKNKALIKKLKSEEKPDEEAIKQAQASLTRNRALLVLIGDVHDKVTKGLKKQRADLQGLAKDFEEVGRKLDAARDGLKEAIKTRDDAAKGFSDQFSAPPLVDTESDTPLAQYMKSLTNQVGVVGEFSDDLAQLRALGLDDKTYKSLLEQGTGALAFVKELLAGGSTAVNAINVLDTQLDTESKTLGVNAGANLYQAGVDAAQGLVNGLVSQQDAIAAEMSVLAKAIVKAIKKALKIKSPSEVFKEIGVFTMTGLANGLNKSSKLVTGAAANVGSATVDAMKKSMSDMSAALTTEINAQPTITPVLDLSQVQRDALTMADMLNKVPITADTSLTQASAISTGQVAAEVAKAVETAGTSVTFEQNNYSPESLSAIEIYRRTQNQLAQARLALA